MIKKITLKEFKKRYLLNNYRKRLFKHLLEELENISGKCKCYKFLIFGSYITRKKEPNDIDVLISLIPEKDYVYSISKDGLQSEFFDEIDIHFMKSQYFIKDVDGLLDFFNENPLNKNKGISIKRAVEIVDL